MREGTSVELKFRRLTADEIECRISMVSKSGSGLSLLVYKDARCDMNILDETVGPFNWQKEFFTEKGTLFCRVGIRDDDGQWVWKSDAGAPSNMEAAKGEASDAFKRVCFNWGIGRELYTAPFIWIPAKFCNIVQDKNGNYRCNDRFKVAKVQMTESGAAAIEGIRIVNEASGAVAFSWKRG